MAFTRSPDTVARDAEAARLRSRGWTYQRIADYFAVTRSAAFQMVQRVMEETLKEPAEQVRQFELERLDDLEASVRDSLERRHYVVSGGKIVFDGAEKLEDDGYLLAATDRLLKIYESRRRLLGLDAAQKLAVTGGVTYQLVGVDPDDV